MSLMLILNASVFIYNFEQTFFSQISRSSNFTLNNKNTRLANKTIEWVVDGNIRRYWVNAVNMFKNPYWKISEKSY